MSSRPILQTVPDVASELRCSPRTVYQLIYDGVLESVKVRGSRRIPTAALDRYVESLSTEARDAAAAQ